MAAASGQSQDTSKTKKEVTPQQRKLYTQLGVIGVLALVVGAIYLPGMLSGGSKPSLPEAPPAAADATSGASNSAPTPPTDGAPNPDGATPPTAVTTVAAVALPAARYRSDPFQQPYFIPTPTPVPPPLPPPIGIPSFQPVTLPVSSRAAQMAQQPLNLPPVSIKRLDEASRAPTDALPPRRSAGSSGGNSGAPTPSTDKRLSGVIIADGVRALLEIQGADGPVTHVVQPGDEVDGITILNIQRFNDGTRTVTRMLIRENGEERSVDLRSAPQQTGATGAQ